MCSIIGVASALRVPAKNHIPATGNTIMDKEAWLIMTNPDPPKEQERKATGPRFLREATDDSPKDPKIAKLPVFMLHSFKRR